MKKTSKTSTPTRAKLSIFAQVCNLIPRNLVPRLEAKFGVQKKVRTFSAWSHVVANLYAQFIHAMSLNDVCDSMGAHCGHLAKIRQASVPSRNALSHANKERDAAMAEALFWETLEHLQKTTPGFGARHHFKGLKGRFKNRRVHIVDSTVLQLVVSCIDWAKHRRRKAAAKCHMRIDLKSMLPRFVLVAPARESDAVHAHEVCAGVRAGEIVLFDRACLDMEHLDKLDGRGVFWVTRAKENTRLKCVKERPCEQHADILQDEDVEFECAATHAKYPRCLRRVRARVELDGRESEMEFLTNNMDWSATTIAMLYRCRWQIEVFFKQLKQTVHLKSFLGQSENAVRWQIWTALLLHLLLRHQAFLHGWRHSFSRLFTYLRGALWTCFELWDFLEHCGTARWGYRKRARHREPYLPGLEPASVG